MPPSALRIERLVKLAASEAKYNAAPMISDGAPTRFGAALCARSSVASSLERRPQENRVDFVEVSPRHSCR
jgi:hypothetical protein